MTNNQALKPCPFCGGKASICEDIYEKYMVICSCGIMLGIELEDGCELKDGWRARFDTICEATEAWNRRADNG